jgi:DNA-binding MarR family transcriptional regulator
MDDITTYALLTAAFFFVALALALLVRYRQVSQRINSSTDLGHDLWSSMEQRLKKQDERILDVMGRLEVIQARVMSAAAAQASPTLAPLPPLAQAKVQIEEELEPVTESKAGTQQPESQISRPSQALLPSQGMETKLDETQVAALKLLGTSPKNTRELTDALKKSREHVARIMKELFEAGLVSRSDASKPFVYQLTDEGKRHAS